MACFFIVIFLRWRKYEHHYQNKYWIAAKRRVFTVQCSHSKFFEQQIMDAAIFWLLQNKTVFGGTFWTSWLWRNVSEIECQDEDIVCLLKEKNSSLNFKSCKLDFLLFSLIEKKIIVMSTYGETLLSYENVKFPDWNCTFTNKALKGLVRPSNIVQ